MMILPSDVAGLVSGNISEISRDGTARFRTVVKDSETPTKRRKTSAASLAAEDPILGYSLSVRYIGPSCEGSDKMEVEVRADNSLVEPGAAEPAVPPPPQQPKPRVQLLTCTRRLFRSHTLDQGQYYCSSCPQSSTYATDRNSLVVI